MKFDSKTTTIVTVPRHDVWDAPDISFTTDHAVFTIETFAVVLGAAYNADHKVAAIKMARTVLNIGLLEAKCFVEDCARTAPAAL